MKIIYIFSILICCNVVCNVAQSIISPFYPTFANDRGITEELVGFIFSAHPIGQMIASLVLGKTITNNNRAILMNIGIIIQGLGLLLFGILDFIDPTKKTIIIVISIIARLLGGFGASMFMTPFYAYIPLLYPKNVEEKIALAEVSTSLGFLVGPVFGSFLYSIGDFILPFFFFTGVCFVLGAILPFFYSTLKFKESILENIVEPIPEDDTNLINKSDQPKDISIIDEHFKISYLQVASQYPIQAICLVNTASNCLWTYYNPTVASYLEQAYDIKPKDAGYYMASNAVAFAVGALIVSKIRKYQKFYTFFGLVITAYIQFYQGPDYKFTNLEQNRWITTVAYGISGFTASFSYVLAIPIINIILKAYYPKYPFQCSNIASALFNSSLAAGELIGPIAGGYMTKQFGYERSASYFGCVILLVALFFAPFLFYTTLRRLK